MGRAEGEAHDMKFLQVAPLLCLAFLAVSAEPEELNIPFSDELVDSLIEDLKPLENENIADTRADDPNLGKDEVSDIKSILDKELGPLMSNNLDVEERLLAEGPTDRGWRSRWKRYRRKWRRSIKKRVKRARRSISKRVRKIRNSVRKRLQVHRHLREDRER